MKNERTATSKNTIKLKKKFLSDWKAGRGATTDDTLIYATASIHQSSTSKLASLNKLDGCLTNMRLHIEYVSIDLLTPHPKNPRKRTKKQWRILAASIKGHGFINPIVVDENMMILAGHGRYEAALYMGLKTVPVIIVRGLTEEQKLSYVLADNQTATYSSWDNYLLGGALKHLDAIEYPIELTGFETAQVDNFLIIEKTSKDDIAVLLPPDHVAITKVGDVLKLGNHLVICGDSTKAITYQRLLGDDRVQMVVTDPPYGVSIKGHVKKRGDNRFHEFVQGTTGKELPSLLKEFLLGMVPHLEDGTIIYVFMDWRHLEQLLDAARSIYEYKQLCVWVKSHGGLGSFYRSQHELCGVFKHGTAPHINNFGLGDTGRYRTNVWQAPAVQHCENYKDDDINHPTIKPVSLIADAIRDCSHRGGVILDPFGGSGTTLIAAERTKRHARLIELDPIYCDMIIKRWEDFTGGKAELVGHYEDVAAASGQNAVKEGQ